MRQGTTPTHTFTLPCSASSVKSALIVYAQNDKILLEKTLADCTASGDSLVLQLTQEETFLFEAGERAQVQVRILTDDGKAFTSDIDVSYVGKSLSKEVLV